MQAINQTRENRDPAFQQALDRYWTKVKDDAQRLCPVDTGTLRSTIRIRHTLPSGRFFEVARQPDDLHVTRYIVAGGLRINPKTKRMCDYAQSVHDGHRSPRGYVVGRPFLTMAIDMNEAYLNQVMDEYFRRMTKDWGGS